MLLISVYFSRSACLWKTKRSLYVFRLVATFLIANTNLPPNTFASLPNSCRSTTSKVYSSINPQISDALGWSKTFSSFLLSEGARTLVTRTPWRPAVHFMGPLDQSRQLSVCDIPRVGKHLCPAELFGLGTVSRPTLASRIAYLLQMVPPTFSTVPDTYALAVRASIRIHPAGGGS